MNKQRAMDIELKAVLSRFNRGVQEVTTEQGIACVYVSGAKTATGVTIDLLRSGGFRSVKAVANGLAGRGFIVHGVPA